MMRHTLLPLLALAFSAQCATAGGSAGGIPAVHDLQRDGAAAAQRRVPIVILYSLPDCSYCETVRRNYLVPLDRDLPAAQRPVLREIGMASDNAGMDFAGRPVTQRALAQRYGIRVAPTVSFLDEHGERLTADLVGGDVSGMYGAYLDAALLAAQDALRARRR